MNEDRLPPLPPQGWSDAQRREADEVIRGPRGALLAPFVPLLRSPELMGHAQRMGEYLRYRSAIGLRLSELAILITAHAWSQPVEWGFHAPIACFGSSLCDGGPNAPHSLQRTARAHASSNVTATTSRSALAQCGQSSMRSIGVTRCTA